MSPQAVTTTRSYRRGPDRRIAANGRARRFPDWRAQGFEQHGGRRSDAGTKVEQGYHEHYRPLANLVGLTHCLRRAWKDRIALLALPDIFLLFGAGLQSGHPRHRPAHVESRHGLPQRGCRSLPWGARSAKRAARGSSEDRLLIGAGISRIIALCTGELHALSRPREIDA